MANLYNSRDLPGPGDSATWPARTHHPNDPRNDDAPAPENPAANAYYLALLGPGGECDPFEFDHFYDALNALPDSVLRLLRDTIRNSRDPALSQIRQAVCAYHEERAEAKVKARFGEACGEGDAP